MLFHSHQFLLFFLVVYSVYWLTPWPRLRVWWLLLCSFYFYASWSQGLALLVTATSIMDYLLARAMDGVEAPRWRRFFLYLSLGVNLGLLCYFKYVNFFLDSLREIAQAAGASTSIPVLEVLIPFGISFYTFEAISYTIDVYRGRLKAEKSLPNFMLFILFFPHLVAGPIVRAWDFLPQARRPKRFSWFRLSLGLQLIALGLFKKLVLADRLALYSDPIFENPAGFSSTTLWQALLAFALRIYCDFSGYSDMALGIAHMLGFKLSRNFNAPYLALNVSDFWRRWHISLSSWLRDYLFIPLGGSRGTNWKVSRNLLVTMLLGGLWHGAAWTYVLWGALHGSYLVIQRGFRQFCESRPRLTWLLDTLPGQAARMGLTFLCVLLAWVFFQPSLEKSWLILTHLFAWTKGNGFHYSRDAWVMAILLIVLGNFFVQSKRVRSLWDRMPRPVMGAVFALLVVIALIMDPDSAKTFIYFQF